MIYFLMPAYNEENRNCHTAKKIIAGLMAHKGFPFEIWVVNDGSDDRTAEIIKEVSKEIPAHVIHHEKNKGIGVAFLNGLRELVKVSGRMILLSRWMRTTRII